MITFAAMGDRHTRNYRDVHPLACRKHGLQPVVIFLRKRIKFVVVATGALERQTQKGGGRGIDVIRQPLITQLGQIQGRLLDLRSKRIQRRANSRFEVLQLFGRHPVHTRQAEIVRPELISGDLLLDEPVIGLVIVEGLDDVIPVAPRIRIVDVAFVPCAVGIPHHVQPMPSPPFSVARRGE